MCERLARGRERVAGQGGRSGRAERERERGYRRRGVLSLLLSYRHRIVADVCSTREPLVRGRSAAGGSLSLSLSLAMAHSVSLSLSLSSLLITRLLSFPLSLPPLALPRLFPLSKASESRLYNICSHSLLSDSYYGLLTRPRTSLASLRIQPRTSHISPSPSFSRS